MIITITEVSQEFTKDGAEYQKVTGINASNNSVTTKSIFDNLEDKWSLLEEGARLDFKLKKKGQFWNVDDISPVGESVQNTETATKEGKPPVNNSIETQVAFKGIIELMASGVIKVGDKEGQSAINWAMSRLANSEPVITIPTESLVAEAEKIFETTKEPEPKKVTQAQRERLGKALEAKDTQWAKAVMIRLFKKNDSKSLNYDQMEEFIKYLNEHVPETKEPDIPS